MLEEQPHEPPAQEDCDEPSPEGNTPLDGKDEPGNKPPGDGWRINFGEVVCRAALEGARAYFRPAYNLPRIIWKYTPRFLEELYRPLPSRK